MIVLAVTDKYIFVRAAARGQDAATLRKTASRLRQRFRQHMKLIISGTLEDPATVDMEMRAMLVALGGCYESFTDAVVRQRLACPACGAAQRSEGALENGPTRPSLYNKKRLKPSRGKRFDFPNRAHCQWQTPMWPSRIPAWFPAPTHPCVTKPAPSSPQVCKQDSSRN